MAAEPARPGVRPRIGLYGGSFDPVHQAHVALARLALDELGLDELRVLPAGTPWQKGGTQAAGEHRAAMLRLAFAGEPRVVVDERELHRGGASYSIDTVRELQAERPSAQWFLVIGQDQYDKFDTWREWQELLHRVTLAVAGRHGEEHTPAALAAVPHLVKRLPLPQMEVSSSGIRERRARGEPLGDDLVPPEVARYIDHNALYDGATARS